MEFYVVRDRDDNTLRHYAIEGQKKGVRRFQNEDGSLTPDGKIRYSKKTGINVRNIANSNPSQYDSSNSNNIDVTGESNSERKANKGKTIYLSSANIRRKTDSTESDGIPEKKKRVIIVARKKEDTGDNNRKITSNFKIISRKSKEVNDDEDDDDTKTVDENNESTEENVENSDEVNEEKETDNEEDTSNRRKITIKVKSRPSSEDLKKNFSNKRRIIVIKK